MDIAKTVRDFLANLQNLPEHHKKIILWTVVVVAGIIMGYFWVYDAASNIGKIKNAVVIPTIDFSNVPAMPTIDLNSMVTDSTAAPIK